MVDDNNEAPPIRSRSGSIASLVLGVISLGAVALAFFGWPEVFASSPLPALIVFAAALLGAALSRSSVALFAFVLALVSVAAAVMVVVLANNPATYIKVMLDPAAGNKVADAVGGIVRWVWGVPAFASALALVADGWQE